VANLREIAFLQGVSSSYTSNLSQTSAKIPLEAGRKYYFQVLHKEGSGQDFFKVRWARPDGVVQDPVPSSALLPSVMSEPTVPFTVRLSVDRGALAATDASGLTISRSNGDITITGSADKIDDYLNSATGLSYQGAGGNSRSVSSRAIRRSTAASR
jgi:hypothetical protein